MKTMVVSSIAFMMLFLCNTVSAAERWITSKLISVYPHANGSIVISFEVDSPSCTNSATPYKYHKIEVGQNSVTEQALNNMHAVALTALTAGFAVSVNFDDSTNQCYVNRIHLKHPDWF